MNTGVMRMSDDTISRKATIDAMENVDWYHISKDGQLVHGANSDDHEPLYKAKDVYAVLNTMPPAQPEKRTEEHTETHACDSISRKAAIDALMPIYKSASLRNRNVFSTARKCMSAIEELPSAQPDLSEYSDKLWKRAYERGRTEALDEIVRCKDCKYWKDSDGVYRRGIGAESKCPVNIRAVYEGNFYCADAERRTDDGE